MKKLFFLLLVGTLYTPKIQAQDIFICRHATISFYSSAPIEDISAETHKAVSAINIQTGTIYFKVPIRSFQFPKSLMQEHFNTDYLQSDQYPFAEFQGTILNYQRPQDDGIYPITVQGKLTIHGVTKDYKESGTLEVKGGKLTAISSFKVTLADHHIKIPTLLFQNIAEVVSVKLNAVYDPQTETADAKK
jgi:polyisoprenoid-binding protein YceI